jgi:hypothetical protein
MFNRNPKALLPRVRTRFARTFGIERLETRSVLNAGSIMGPVRDPWQSQDQPMEQSSSRMLEGTGNKPPISSPHDYGSPSRDFGGFNSMSGFGSPAGRAPTSGFGYNQPVIIIFVIMPPSTATSGATSNLRGPESNPYADSGSFASQSSSESGPQRVTAPPVNLPAGLASQNAAADLSAHTSTARNISPAVQNAPGVVPVRPVALANPVANPLITTSAPAYGVANVAIADPFEGLRDSGAYANLASDVKVLAAQAAADGDKVEVVGDVDGSEIASDSATIITAPARKVLLAEIPFNLHGLEQAVQTVMGQVQRIGTEFTEWLEENQLTSAATIIAATAAGSGAVFYLRRRAARAADRRDEEASSNWLFVQMQTAPSRD